MRGAKLPIIFVVAVVGALVAGALGLVVLAGLPDRGGAERSGQAAHAARKPTGSSITASSPRPLPSADSPSPDSPWPSASTSARQPSATSSSPTTSTRRPSATTSAPAVRGTPMTVSYSVTGPASATVLTYWRADHDIASEHGTALPWSRTVTLVDQGLIRLSAQVDHGAVHCAIAVDGQVVAEASADFFVSCEARPAPASHDR
ncbi:MAG: MmpS family transport accessory protein [Segniliparus sp.]|uniref:MmpS family transport accessory protein n=1 Tax=Segniliparus sp. TaxID=2804064 RepID=UPI003F3A0644